MVRYLLCLDDSSTTTSTFYKTFSRISLPINPPNSQAIKNDWNSTIEEQVVKGIVDKQRKLGKLDALTEKVKGITWLWGAYGGVCRARGDILKYIAIAGSVFGLSTTAVVFLACTLYMNNFSNKAALAVSSAQAASNVMTLFSVLALLLLLARHGSMKLLLRAKLIKAWIGSIVFIDLDEIGVDVEAIARVGLELSGHGAAVAGGGFVIALAVWLKAVATM